MIEAATRRSRSSVLPALAVAVCGALWGILWYPMHAIEALGLGGGWTSLVFNLVVTLAPVPWLLRRNAWRGSSGQILTGLLLGTAFSLYLVSLVMTDIIHAILLFYLTPVWSTLAGRLWLGERLTATRLLAMALGFAGLAAILGVSDGLPLPRKVGDWVALASGMLWAAGTLRSFARPVSGIALPVFTFGLGGTLSSALILLAAAFLAHPLAAGTPSAAILPWMLVTALVIYLPPNALVLWAAQRIDSARVGILLMTEVLAGAVTAALFSGEAFGVADAAGTALIVAASLIEVTARR